MIRKNIIFISLLSLFFAASPAVKPVMAQDNPREPVMRVLVIDDKYSIYIMLDDKYTVSDYDTGKLLMKGLELKTRLKTSKNGFRIGSKELDSTDIMVRIAPGYDIYIDGRRFRGDVEIVKKDNGKLMVINFVGMEDYLKGVLYHEVSHKWPMECLKVQAVAARTFALYQARMNKMQPYDLRSDIYSQVYGGKNSEKWSTNIAVDSTKGKVLTYKGDIFPAYFHATCAGYTEDASNLWNIDIPPLDGGYCDFCREAKYYSWTKMVPLEDLEEILRQNGYKIGSIRTVSVLSKNISGRVDKLEFKDDQGVTLVLTGKIFRGLMGPNVVRSTKFNAYVRLDQLVLNGYGWGHGVGMCQWGAYGMATQGRKADQILKYYYPGSEIATIDKIPANP